MRLSDREWAVAREVCTAKQLAALDLWRRGAGRRRIAMVLQIDASTAREHVRRGLNRLSRALEEDAA